MSLEAVWYGRAPWWERALWAVPLAPLSWLYGAAVAVRGAAWSSGLLTPERIDGLTVVSVGNLVAGGAGKTPVVIHLARWAQACGRQVAVLSRGYGRADTEVRSFTSAALPPVEEVGDEPRLIARRCPGAQVWVGADRVALARRARASGCTFAVLDDGFQHRRLHRDVDVLVEASGATGHLLPWGPLREARRAASRADIRWSATPGASVHATVQPVRSAWLAGKPVLALAGIARPWRFVDTLKACGAAVLDTAFFADHHPFSAAELERVSEQARALGCTVVTTEKDRERLPDGFAATALELEVVVHSGADQLAARLGLLTG